MGMLQCKGMFNVNCKIKKQHLYVHSILNVHHVDML